MNYKRLLNTVILVSVALLLQACSSGEEIVATPLPTPVLYGVDPLFREMYEHWGGHEILGEAISPLLRDGVYQYQYVQAGLMVFDPEANPQRRFYLAPLGYTLGVGDPQSPAPESPSMACVGGHYIAQEFLPLYERLGGVNITGLPLTELRYNPVMKRYEQYFENVGFYRMDGDPVDKVHLLDYGAWRCGDMCRQVASNGRVDPENSWQVGQLISVINAQKTVSYNIEVRAEAALPSLAEGQHQVISVWVYLDGQPLPNAEPKITVTMPNKGDSAFYPLPTDEHGNTLAWIGPIDASPATVIPFQACVPFDGREFCAEDTFVIWWETGDASTGING